MLTPSLEDYLEEVYRFSLTGEVVRVTDISHKLNVTMPSVTKALRKLRSCQYIVYQRYGFIELTDKGSELGKYLVERNRLLQEFLTLIRTKCDIAAEAEAMEHYLSSATINSIRQLVDFFCRNPDVYKNFTESD